MTNPSPKDQAQALAEECAEKLMRSGIGVYLTSFAADQIKPEFEQIILSTLQLERLIEDRERWDKLEINSHPHIKSPWEFVDESGRITRKSVDKILANSESTKLVCNNCQQEVINGKCGCLAITDAMKEEGE